MSEIFTKTLRPGLLVSLKTQLSGGVSYEKNVIKPEHHVEGVGEVAIWKTSRVIDDRQEHDLGRKAQMEARSFITKVCANTPFGLLCPESEAENLEKALKEARKVAEKYNATSKVAKLSVYMITGRVSPDDVEAVKAISAEIDKAIKSMAEGVANCDANAIREAANEARKLGTMLATEASGRVQEAIATGRKAARAIKKAGEQAAQEVDRQAIARLEECRTAFLDMDGQKEIAAPEEESKELDLVPQLDLEDAIKEAV